MWRIRGLSRSQAEYIQLSLTVENPEVARKKRFTGWVGNNIPRHLRGWVNGGNELLVAPGAVHWIWRWLSEQDPPEYPGYSGPTLGMQALWPPYNGHARTEQITAKHAMLVRRMGYCCAPCGAGKTDLGIQILCERQTRSLVLVHTKELLDQWVDRIRERTGLECSTVVAGKARGVGPESACTIATVQSLWANPSILAGLRQHRDLVIVDEAHHTPARTFTEILAGLNPVFRYGFTATPDRADGLGVLLDWWIGPQLCTISRSQLEQESRTMRPRLVAHPLYTFTYDYNNDEPGDYGRMMKALAASPSRVADVVNCIGEYNFPDRWHLVLAQYLDLATSLYHELKGRFPTAVLINGQMPKRERDAAMTTARERKTNCIISTTLADEGLDLPHLTDAWLCTPTRSAGKAEQRAGRVCRFLPDKIRPVVHDFVDRNVTVLVNQFRARLRVWRKIAYVDDLNIREVLR